MAKKLLLCILSVLLSVVLYAQNTKFTTEDDAFFELQMPYLQQWLDGHKIGNIVKTDRLTTDLNEGIVVVHLVLNYQTADSASAAYAKLKSKFMEKNGQSFEQVLFYKAAQLMEVDTRQIHVEITDKVECRLVRLTLENEALKIDDILCRAITKQIDIRDFTLKSQFVFASNVKTADNTQSEATVRQNTLKKIREEAQKYFTNRKQAVFNLLGVQNGLLRFEVKDIKQEILRDGAFFEKYEMITFSISCQKVNTDTRIIFVIDAKSGASFPWKPRLSAFEPIDATKEGQYQMEKYAYLFGAMIEQWLSK